MGVPCEEKEFEIGGLDLQGNHYFTSEQIATQLASALSHQIPFEQQVTGTIPQARLLSWQRHYYWNAGLTDSLPLCKVTAQELRYHSEAAVFSPALKQDAFGTGKVTDTILQNDGKYVLDNGYWWNPGLTEFYNGSAMYYLPQKTVDPFGAETAVTYDAYNLIPKTVTDALGNVTTIEVIDYHTLQPQQISDINGNTSEVLFDPLGLVIATSIYGTEGDQDTGDLPLIGYTPQPDTTSDLNTIIADVQSYESNSSKTKSDFLQDATSYFFYNLDAWQESRQPPYSINLLRETHVKALAHGEKTAIQIHIAYSDGFGRALQNKLKVDPGPALSIDPTGNIVEGATNDRWLTSGRTVYNNKGKPVKQYEPFYSVGPQYESEKELTEYGVTPILRYDPLLRVIQTDTPKGFFSFFSKVEFTPWVEKQFDANDTVKDSKFYTENNGKTALGKDEQDALGKAALHDNTPQTQVMDNQGRPFLTIQMLSANAAREDLLITHLELDIEGNELSSTDPRLYAQNVANSTNNHNFEHTYDMDGDVLWAKSADAGERWSLQDVMGRPIHSWDSRDFHISMSYDLLHRPTQVKVEGNDGNGLALTQIVEKMVYGEGQTDDKKNNLRGKLVQHYDQAGIVNLDLYDIKGELRTSRRQLRAEYKDEVNWNDEESVALEKDDTGQDEVFTIEYEYDALGRVVSQTHPEGSTSKPTYHPEGWLKSVQVTFADSTQRTFVKSISYDPKGQRTEIEYDNGVTTTYNYDPKTFELISLQTVRASDSKKLQDITYTYDPVGNITRIRDKSYQTVFSKGQKVEPLCEYTYDALYQLIQATGREHPALTGNEYKSKDSFKQSQYLNLNDSQQLQKYTQKYAYDPAGNMTWMRHTASDTSRSWTRDMQVSETSNRGVLKERVQGSQTVDDFFDAHGDLTSLENVRAIRWNYRDNIASVDLKQRDNQPSDTEYYVYDSAGQRIRKVSETLKNSGTVTEIEEKLYLGGVEIKRIKQKSNGKLTQILDRWSLHVMDDQQRVVIAHNWKQDDRHPDKVGSRQLRYQLDNHLGSVSLELSEAAEIISYEGMART